MHGQAHHDASQSTLPISSLSPPPIFFPSLCTHAPRPIHPSLSQVEPGQHPTQTHHDARAAQRTTSIRIAHTSPTAARGVDPHTQTFRYAASLTPHPRSLARLRARLCLGLSPVPVSPNIAMTHDNDPTDVFVTPAPPSLRYPLHSAPSPSIRACLSIVLSIPETYLLPLLDPFIHLSLALTRGLETLDFLDVGDLFLILCMALY